MNGRSSNKPPRSTGWSPTRLRCSGCTKLVIAKPQPVDTWEWDSALQEVARSSLAGTIELKLADYTASIVDLAKALSVCSMWHGSDVNPCGLGVQDNNIAVAMLHVGDFSSAEEHARTAIATDPDNALYVEALANIKEQAGDLEAAAQEYRATLALDPSQSSARNNLGVILAKSGAVGGAVEQFRFAVGAQPDYAVAWFNLGLALERQGAPGSYLDAQGAFGAAAALDFAFRSADHDWVSDQALYDPGLDLSKPLPKDWSAATGRRPVPIGVTVGVALIATLTIARSLVSDDVYGRITEWALRRRRVRDVAVRSWSESVAVLWCAAIATFLLHQATGSHGLWSWVAAGAFGLALTAAFAQSRRLLGARAGLHRWDLWAVAVAILGMPIGLGYVPMPVLSHHGRPRRFAWWAAQVTIGALAVSALAVAWRSGVPLIRGVGQVSFLMLSSSLVPLEPFDGAQLTRGWSAVVGITTFVAAVLLATGAV